MGREPVGRHVDEVHPEGRRGRQDRVAAGGGQGQVVLLLGRREARHGGLGVGLGGGGRHSVKGAAVEWPRKPVKWSEAEKAQRRAFGQAFGEGQEGKRVRQRGLLLEWTH